MNNLVKIGLGLAIAVVFPVMVGLGIEAFYPSPQPAYKQCESLSPRGEFNLEQQKAFDDCIKQNEEPIKEYDRNVFFITMIIGLVAIGGGALFLKDSMGPIVPGIVFGGIFTILYGSGRAFNAVDKRLLFLEMVIVLGALILITKRYVDLTVKEKK